MRALFRRLAFLLPLAVAACAVRPAAVPPSHPHGSRYAVATENASATHAAETILEKGGNAVDAAVAAAFAVDVAVPVSTGLGGGGFAMVWIAKERRAHCIDFRETAPAALDPRSLDLPDAPPGVAIGAPGSVLGLSELHRRWGKLSFADDIDPAATLAERGIPISPHLVKALQLFGRSIGKVPVIGAMLLPGGAPLRAGSEMPWPALGRTLRTIAKDGPRAFYEGPIARAMVDATRAAGGTLTEEDLRTYAVVEREPLHGTYEGLDIYTMPAPSGGGLMLLQALAMLPRVELSRSPSRSAESVHTLAESFRASFADRARHVGDPDLGRVELSPLLDPAMLARRRAAILPRVTRTPAAFLREDHGTTHLVVADAEGNVVALTTTLNNPFGAGVYAESVGVLMNDELNDFSSAEMAKMLGLPSMPGAARARARPPSSMTPTLAVEGGEVVLAVGGAGGFRIPTGVTQVALAVLGRGQPIADAIAEPRFHTDPTGVLTLETGELAPDERADLAARGEAVKEGENWGSVDGLTRTRQGATWLLQAAGEPRRYGLAVAR